ncbi:unnamed protein product, partial [marine sediment metagenome]
QLSKIIHVFKIKIYFDLKLDSEQKFICAKSLDCIYSELKKQRSYREQETVLIESLFECLQKFSLYKDKCDDHDMYNGYGSMYIGWLD